ncbi:MULTISPECIES: single-stranded-DNA-specific exonuclease RecJ [Bartonella]|uniref:single-stranded-DNA-specific exonuclease RecJ n=1 Tax=Bartonella TaxID=773 RepID=UPI0018DE1B90|nr:single-stranded-DNA-specific exonuclease RecJ [Bartonella choladocola]MBI0015018.1 single-stranded-DNA-specific exonuclease RecJ [Bartonella sp. B10834G3]
MQRKQNFLGVTRSAVGRSWTESLDREGVNNARSLSQKFGIAEPLARVLAARSVSEDEVLNYLEPTLKTLTPDPTTFIDMEKATDRILQAINRKEKVTIFGDYDVDGACSSAILYQFLTFFGLDVHIYIPDRLVEGYGPNPQAMRMLADEGSSLIVTVDCGANSPEAIKAAREKGVDVVVLDHHQMGEVDPAANALVNPNRPDDRSGQGYLCAAGLVFIAVAWTLKKIRAEGKHKTLPDILRYLDLVALATVCDVVPLVGVNRAFVIKGLKVARMMSNPGIAALSRVAGIGEPLNVFHLGFLLGPRINAGGRIGDQALGARLLTTQTEGDAESIAEELNALNQERQNIEAKQLLEAEVGLQSLTLDETPSVIVVAHEGWHPGIVGILAARLKEKFRCPAFAIAIKNDGTATGSGRSIAGVNLGELVREAVQSGLLEKGGGHAMAAGVTISSGKIDEFRKWLNEKLSSKVNDLHAHETLLVDGVLSASGATRELYEMLEKAGPFGSGNPLPVFVLPSHRLADVREVGKGHLMMSISNTEGKRLKAIAFRAVGTDLGDFLMTHFGKNIHVAGNLNLNYWNGQASPQFRVIDAAEPE